MDMLKRHHGSLTDVIGAEAFEVEVVGYVGGDFCDGRRYCMPYGHFNWSCVHTVQDGHATHPTCRESSALRLSP